LQVSNDHGHSCISFVGYIKLHGIFCNKLLPHAYQATKLQNKDTVKI